MNVARRTANIEDLVDKLIELNLAQVADLREYAQAAMAGEGTIQLERNLRRREAQRTDLYCQFEQAAFSTSPAKDLADQT